MATNKQSTPVIVNRITAMKAGFLKNFTAKMSLTMEGVSMLQPAIIAELDADLALVTEADAARKTLATKVAAKKAGRPGTTKFLSELEAGLKTAFGSGAAQLQDFGIQPPKARKQLTAEEKALSVAAAKGTKKVRGIIGKNVRSAITTQGKPGLVVVDPQGNVVPGAVKGPTPPGSATPIDVAAVGGSPTPGTSSQPSASGSSTPSGSGK